MTRTLWSGLRFAVGSLALLILAVGARAQGSIGIGGVDISMSSSQVAAAITGQGQRVFSASERHVEAILTDPETKATVRARFKFDESGRQGVRSVEFVQDDDKFVKQYQSWLARLGAMYGPNRSRQNSDGATKDLFCHSKTTSVLLALFEQRVVLAYFYNPAGSVNCKAAGRREGSAVAYDWRLPAARTPDVVVSPGSTKPADTRTVSKGPSPLRYASSRSKAYQDTLRCASVAAYNGLTSTGAEKARWNGVVNGLSRELVGHGRSEGMSPSQVNSEGRSIAEANHAAYRQGRADSSGTPYVDLDREFCRAAGAIPG